MIEFLSQKPNNRRICKLMCFSTYFSNHIFRDWNIRNLGCYLQVLSAFQTLFWTYINLVIYISFYAIFTFIISILQMRKPDRCIKIIHQTGGGPMIQTQVSGSRDHTCNHHCMSLNIKSGLSIILVFI